MKIDSQPVFRASWPKTLEPTLSRKLSRFTWNALCSTVLFPVGIARLFNHYVLRPHIIKNSLIPAIKNYQGHSIQNNRVIFEMANGQPIEGTFIRGKKHPDKLVIFHGGNGQWCEHISNAVLQKLGTSILSVNHPGVGNDNQKKAFPGTKGIDTEESLGLTAFSAHQYARFVLGFAEDKTLQYGFSLGGVEATLGAKYIQDTYSPEAVKLVNDRSLAGSVVYLSAYFRLIKDEIKKFQFFSLRGRLMKSLIVSIPDALYNLAARIFCLLTGLTINAEAAFKKLKTKNKCLIYTEQDSAIPYHAGAALHKRIEKLPGFHAIRLSDKHDHCTPFGKAEEQAVLSRISQFLGISH